jgi:hypothetical protein
MTEHSYFASVSHVRKSQTIRRVADTPCGQDMVPEALFLCPSRNAEAVVDTYIIKFLMTLLQSSNIQPLANLANGLPEMFCSCHMNTFGFCQVTATSL